MQAPARGNNFDLLRLILAVLVVRCHAALVGLNLPWTEEIYFLGGNSAVECFFVISGYLIFKSWEATPRVPVFVSKRVRRILPAYLVVTVGAALVLGFASTAGVTSYWSSAETYQYIAYHLLFLGFMQNTLPGVFMDNVQQYVNGPLWTIKIEVWFYVSVPLIAYLTSKVNRAWGLGCIYLLSVLWRMSFEQLAHAGQWSAYEQIARQLPGQLSFFVAAGGIFYFPRLLQNHRAWLVPISVLWVALYFTFGTPAYLYPLYPFALAVSVIAFAELAPYLGNWGRWGDLSYGIYIYHFPILQLFSDLDPTHRNPWLMFLGASSCTLVAALLSWHLVEKRWLMKSSHYVKANSSNDMQATSSTNLDDLQDRSQAIASQTVS